MSTMAASPPTSFLASPRSVNDLEDLIDLSAFGSNASRQPTPSNQPLTPPMDSLQTLDYQNDSFYQSFFRDGPGPSTDNLILNEKDVASSWSTFSTSLNGLSMNPADSYLDPSNPAGDVSLFSSANYGIRVPHQDTPLSPISDSAVSSSLASIPEDGAEVAQSFAIDPSLVNVPNEAIRSSLSPPIDTQSAARHASPVAGPSKTGSKARKVSSTARSVVSSHADDDDDSEGDAEDDDDDLDLRSVTDDLHLPMQGSGSAAMRKSASGIVQSGGISKRVTSAVVNLDKDNDPDDWRPSPEEYKKMSSKEKRQLRNKISARNFRVRRKEYITTLEGHIADRDQLIEAIKRELGDSQSENDVLRAEIDTLKKAMLEGRSTSESLGLQAPVKLDANGKPIRPQSPVRRSSTINQANTRKDLASSGSTPFWGGAQASNGLFGGNVTSVHTTFVPEAPLSSLFFPSGSPSNSPSASNNYNTSALLSGKAQGWWGREPENINPLLNKMPHSPTASSPSSLPSLSSDSESSDESSSTTSSPKSKPLSQMPGMTRFDAFMELNPFTIKSADDYRMHLWGQMAQAKLRQQQSQFQTQQAPQTSHEQLFAQPNARQLNPSDEQANKYAELFASMRPAFFSQSGATKEQVLSPKSTATTLMAGKSSSSLTGKLHPTSPSASPSLGSTKSSPSASSTGLAPTPQQAFVATLASQTLLSRMGSAFWDAFAGRSSSAGGSSSPAGWDSEKVRKVLEGKAVVRVVDVETESPINEKHAGSNMNALEERMRGMNIAACDKDRKSGHADAAAGIFNCNDATGIFHNLRK